jgi:stalled ribosome rescue protein Dom34
MTYRHAIVWLDHREATVIDYSVDGRHVVNIANEHAPKRIHRKSGIPGSGREGDEKAFFDDVATAIRGAEEVVVTGPGLTKSEFRRHVESKHPLVAKQIVGFETLDHPTEGQLLAFARTYFKRVDALRGDVVEETTA